MCVRSVHTHSSYPDACSCTTWNCTNSSCLRIPIVAAVVGVGANHGVHCIRRLDRLAQEQVRLHELIRSDRNQPIHHIVLMNTIRRMQSVANSFNLLQLFETDCNWLNLVITDWIWLKLFESCCNWLNLVATGWIWLQLIESCCNRLKLIEFPI